MIEWHISNVSCGASINNTLALSREGYVFSFEYRNSDKSMVYLFSYHYSFMMYKIYDLLDCEDKSLNVIPSMIVFDYEIVSVYCRNDVNAVIDCVNNVFTWGKGNNNMLGHNNSFCVNRPKEVKFLSGKFVYS